MYTSIIKGKLLMAIMGILMAVTLFIYVQITTKTTIDKILDDVKEQKACDCECPC